MGAEWLRKSGLNMADPYDYLMKKLGFHFNDIIVCSYKFLYWNDEYVFQTSADTTMQTIYKSIWTEIKFLGDLSFNIGFQTICDRFSENYQLFRILPEELTSCEEVDLLLTLNGLNNDEHLNSK